jgi:hypothetical protein
MPERSGLLAIVIQVLSVQISLVLADGPIGYPCFAGENASQLYSDIDMTGTFGVVTGADTGVGYEIVRALAARKMTVIMAPRNVTHAQLAADELRRDVPGASIIVPDVGLDLSSMQSTRDYAEAVYKLMGGKPLFVLVRVRLFDCLRDGSVAISWRRYLDLLTGQRRGDA